MVPDISVKALGVAKIVALVFPLFAVKLADTEVDQSLKNDVPVRDPLIKVAPSEVMWDCLSNTMDCSLPTTVNYRVPNMEFVISFDCSLAPFSNDHSQKVFRKVFSYRLDGRTVCCDVGVGLQYLHFPHNIKLLVLEGYCIRSLPSDTFQHFDNLERLEIIASRFGHLASLNFLQLHSLNELLLENNEFETMESGTMDVLVQLQSLRILNCTGIDFTISSLEQLHVVELEWCMVKNISSIFNSVPSMLRTISSIGVMSDENPSIAVEPTLKDDNKLQTIVIVECFLTSASVRNFPEVVSLNLSKNLLNENSIDLVNLPVLQKLILSHNILKLIPTLLFGVGPTLDIFDLSHNQLSYIQPDTFSLAPSVSTLDLSHNAFLNLGNFLPWPNLVHILVNANPWDCLWLQHSRKTNPILFEKFKYSKQYDVLAIFGLPCTLEKTTEVVTTKPSSGGTVHNVITTLPNRGYPQGEIIHHGPKTTITEPLHAVAKPLAIILTVAVGILISHVIILLYNRYRQLQHIPFYHHLSKERSVFDTITEKSTSFMYETPMNNDQYAVPLNNIYEEITEIEPFEPCVNYDVLNFQNLELQHIDETNGVNIA